MGGIDDYPKKDFYLALGNGKFLYVGIWEKNEKEDLPAMIEFGLADEDEVKHAHFETESKKLRTDGKHDYFSLTDNKWV